MQKLTRAAAAALCSILFALGPAALLLTPTLALAQSNPGFVNGQPAPTAGQWNTYFSNKVDYSQGVTNAVPYQAASGKWVMAPLTGDVSTSIANRVTVNKLNGVAPGTMFPLNYGSTFTVSGGTIDVRGYANQLTGPGSWTTGNLLQAGAYPGVVDSGCSWSAPCAYGTVTPNTGKFTTLQATGHTTFEGVTSTGATGTGNFVYSISPTFTGTVSGDTASWSTRVTTPMVAATGNLELNPTGTLGLFTTTSPASGSIKAGFVTGLELAAVAGGGIAWVPNTGGGANAYTFTGVVGSETYGQWMSVDNAQNLTLNGRVNVQGAASGSGASRLQLGWSAGASQLYSMGADASTVGTFGLFGVKSDGTGGGAFLTSDTSLNATFTGVVSAPYAHVTSSGSTTAGTIGYTAGTLNYGDGVANHTVVSTDQSQTLTNKTLASPTLSGTVAGSNTIPLSILAQSGANTMLGNWTGSTANVTANSVPSCADTSGNHLNYVAGTGITCGTSSSGGSLVKLATLTASSSASISDTTHITGTYNAYWLVLSNLIPAVDNGHPEFQFSTNSGGSWLATGYLSVGTTYIGGIDLVASIVSTSLSEANVASTTTSGGLSGSLLFTNPNNTGGGNSVSGALYMGKSGSQNFVHLAGGNSTTSVINGIRFLYSTGNIASGTIEIFGVVPYRRRPTRRRPTNRTPGWRRVAARRPIRMRRVA